MSHAYTAWDDSVATALAAHTTAVERLAARHWTFTPRSAGAPRGSARVVDEWLVVDVLLPVHLERRLDGCWHALAANAALAGGLKLCPVAAGDRRLHLRADVPLLEDVPLTQRIRQLCAGLDAAIAWLPTAHHSAAPAPLPDLGACEADFDLQERCRQTQWPCIDRGVQAVMVQLDVRGAFQQAVVAPQPGRGVVASVPLLAAPLPAAPHEPAIVRLLLATAGAVRMVRAATTGSPASVGLEVVFAHAPTAEELAHAFAALSVAWGCAGRETEILARDARIAQLYASDGVERRGDETVNHSTS